MNKGISVMSESETDIFNDVPEGKNGKDNSKAKKENAANVPAVQGTGSVSTSGAELDTINDLNNELMREITGAIEDNTELSELQIPRLAMLQPQSPEITGEEAGYIPGQMIDSITREILSDCGKPPWLKGKVDDDKLDSVNYCLVVPVFKLPVEYIKWIPKNEQQAGEQGWEFKTLDKTDRRVREGVWPPIGIFKGKKPPVTTNINILAMILDPNEKTPRTNFIVITFSRTSFNTGKEFVTNCNQHKMSGLPYWGRCYYVWTKKKTDKLQSGTVVNYFLYKLARGPRTQDVNKELNSVCFSMAMTLSGYKGRDEDGKNIFDRELARHAQESLINSAVFSDEADATDAGTTEEEDVFD